MLATITQAKSICRFCIASCPVVVDFEDGRPVRVAGNRASPSYHGFCCTRGQAVPEQFAHPGRLLHSQRRSADGSHEAIASEQAMDEVAAKVRAIVDAHGPRSVALYMGTYSGPYPAGGSIAGSWVTELGSPMIFTSMTIDQPGKDIAAALLGGWEAGPHVFDESDVWMIIGANPLVSIGLVMPYQNPGRRMTEALQRGMKLIVIDPRRTQTARRAHIHLAPRPGEDATLLAAMIHVILAEDLHDAEFARENVSGIEALRNSVAPFTPAYAAGRAGVPAEDIVEAARTFARARRGIAAGATGANMSGRSSLHEYLIQCLNTICGRFVREGERVPTPGVLLSRATPRAQARPPRPARDLGVPMAARGLGLAASGMPTAALADEILAGGVKALFSLGGNPAAAWPDQNRTVAALEKLELFVQFDIRMSASARLADYVIAPKISFETPTMSWAHERVEAYHSSYSMPEPFGCYAPALMDPPQGSDLIEEWEFFWGMATRLGQQLRVHFHESTSATARETRDPIDLDMTRKPTSDELFEALTHGSRIPLSEVKKYPDGKIFDADIRVAPKEPGYQARMDVGNPDMMAELAEVLEEPTLEQRYGKDYPFLLMCRRAAHVNNSAGRDLPLLVRKGGSYNPAFMHPEDMAELGLSQNDEIEIVSPHGRIPGIVHAEAYLRRGTVSMTHSFGDLPDRMAEFRQIGSNTSQLTSVEDDYDRYSGIPRMSAVPVAIRALSDRS